MNPEEQTDPAWELLKQARKASPSPLFARNVVREARTLAERPSGASGWFRHLFPPRAVFGGALACATAVIGIALLVGKGEKPEDGARSLVSSHQDGSVEGFDPASELAAIEYLGQLMAVIDPGQLDDAVLADLFF